MMFTLRYLELCTLLIGIGNINFLLLVYNYFFKKKEIMFSFYKFCFLYDLLLWIYIIYVQTEININYLLNTNMFHIVIDYIHISIKCF